MIVNRIGAVVMNQMSPLASCILVVLYNRELKQSTTLQSLLKYNFSDCSLTIINNGPKAFDEDVVFINLLRSKFPLLNIETHLENMPLSIAYNSFFVTNKGSCKFILLDDDTVLTDLFASKINESNWQSDLELPKIISTLDNSIHYPYIDLKPVLIDCILPPDRTLSIGSGMIINKSLIEKFENHGLELFDSHYALYGVDFSLFRRIRMLHANGEQFIIETSSGISHSLSKIEGDTSLFRVRERLYDKVVSAKNYPSIKQLTPMFRTFIKYILLLKFSFVFLMIKTYWTGYHPRCKQYFIK